MSRQQKRAARRIKAVRSSLAMPPRLDPEQHWSRAGAHNIAGVSFQVAVTARLLLDARSGEHQTTRITPEGFEDIDMEVRDGHRILVQVKERSAKTRFSRSDLAEALRQRSRILAMDARRRFVLATNATLGEGLMATGWDQPISQSIPEAELDRLAEQLASSFDDPHEILNRTFILQIERGVVEGSRHDLAQIMHIQPSVATLVYARLVELITEIAVRQRSTTLDTAEWIAPSDLDALVARVVEAVDVESLDEAIRTGIIEPLDFSVRADLSIEEFLAGVDALPAHIAADLDLPRSATLQQLTTALHEQHSVLLTGPSGAGKSALMWRTARELSGSTRPYRLLRLLPSDVPTLARWVRMQEPSKHFPLLLCADDLGRSTSAGWTELAREFVDRPGVLLLGACREEDYRPELVIGHTTIVDPKLDSELAASIAGTLAGRHVRTTLDVSEAFEASEGLLMEFISMLVTGRRLRQVVEQQIADRFSGERTLEREVIRYVATAHAASVALPAAILSTLIPDRDLTPALAVLQREHILIADDGDRWLGLHELRSAVARDYLHHFPPPTLAFTIRRLVEHLPVDDACRLIEVYARQDADLVSVAEVVSEILSSREVSAADGTRFIASLAMADAFRHARACLRVTDERRPRNLDPETALLFAYTHRFSGVSLDSLTDIHPNFARMTELADALPPRPPSLRDITLRTLTAETIFDIAVRGTFEETVEWLESLEDSPAAQVVPSQEVWRHFRDAPLTISARLVATLNSLAPILDENQAAEAFGDVHHRVNRMANNLADCLGADIAEKQDGKVVTLRLLAPEDDAELHERSVQTCRLIFDLCPEAEVAEVIVLTPDGDRYAIGGDFEPGNKRIPRANLPRARQTSVNANFLRAARLLLASRYWTEAIRTLAETARQLLTLRDEAAGWLVNPHHNARRRRQAVVLTNDLVAQLAAGPREPMGDDGAGGSNTAKEALSEALSVVRDLAALESSDSRKELGLGVRGRSAVKRLRAARARNLPTLSTAGDPLPESLDELLGILADLLIARSERRSRVLAPPGTSANENWFDVAQRSIGAAALDGYQTEEVALGQALGTPFPEWGLQRIRHSDPDSVQFLTDWWVIVIPAERNDADPFAFASRLEPVTKAQLEFRTFTVFGVAGQLIPIHAFKLGTSQFWPADADELATIASALGLDVMNSPQLAAWNSFTAELVRSSRAATLRRLREQEDLTGDAEAFATRYEAARKAARACHPSLQADAQRLLARVEREQSGVDRTLAGEVYRSVTHGEQTDDVAALTTLQLVALGLDVQL